MKKVFFITLAILGCGGLLSAQGNTALGGSVGFTNYYGEYNQSKIIHAPKVAGSFYLKNGIGTRIAIRTGIMFGSVAYNYEYYHNNIVQKASGSASIKELSSVLEFSFYDVEYKNRTISGSPYLVAGIGLSLPSTEGAFFGDKAFVLPFGIGYKLQTSSKFEIGAEFLIRKTNKDIFDKLQLSAESTFLHNNDYYSTVSLLISYKFFKFAGDCPVYVKKKNY